MHETNDPLVKAYIDKIEYDGHGVIKILRGWAFHQEKGALSLRIRIVADQASETCFPVNREPRKDVAQFYGRDDLIQVGWAITEVPYNYESGERIELVAWICDTWRPILSIPVQWKKVDSSLRRNAIPSFLVIDNVYNDPDSVREFALSKTFQYHPDYHKGKRTNDTYRFDGLKEFFEEALGRTILNWDSYGTNGCFQYCIAGDQLVYHHDTQQYAGVLFLTKGAPPQCGTTFYRSKHTLQMKVPAADHKVVFQNGFLDPTEFEVVDVVGNVYNRVVLFDAKIIHAASCYFGTNISNGRLFQLFFFDLA